MTTASLTEKYDRERPYLESALATWTDRLQVIARDIDPASVVSGRVKSYRSMIGKAYRKPGRRRDWKEFGDLVALKAVFPTKPGVDAFTEALNEIDDWTPRLDRKESGPDELKYKSMQFDLSAPDIVDSEGLPIEIEVQVRTAVSDAWYVVDHRLKYKGVVDLPGDLKRKLSRLIVLTELFDEEVEAVLNRQVELPDYAVARLYESLMKLSESLLNGQTHTSRPEGLLELMLTAYPNGEIDNLQDRIGSFADTHQDELRRIFAQHQYGSPQFVEERDWIYYEPEALLVAERSVAKPRLLRSALENSDFEPFIEPMIDNFRLLK